MFLEEVYPEYDPRTLIERHHESLLKLEAIYTELECIAEQEARYDLHWALENAEAVHTELTEEMEMAVADCLASCSLQGKNQHEIDTVEERLRRVDTQRSRGILHNAEYFSLISFAVSLVDIAISVTLIVIISEIAHIGGTLLDSVILGLFFVAVIAFLKVSLDRFVILPAVGRWGWRRYRSAIAISKKTMIKLKGITMTFPVAITRHEDFETIMKEIERGIRKI